MSLAKALAQLPDDAETLDEAAAVLTLFVGRPEEEFSAEDVARSTGVALERVRRILGALVSGFVLDFDGVGAYRYERDVSVSFEIDAFLERRRAHKSHLQDNVVRFRSRHGL